jgi:hypothetical protein
MAWLQSLTLLKPGIVTHCVKSCFTTLMEELTAVKVFEDVVNGSVVFAVVVRGIKPQAHL